MAYSICPWWLGYFLVNPLRKIWQNPDEILKPYVHEGMSLLDVGCGMGFFTLPLARLAGNTGSVLAVDLQEKMLKSLVNRAEKAGLATRITPRRCSTHSLNIEDFRDQLDFALAFAMVHEVPDKTRLLGEIYQALKAGGRLLLVEPRGHVSKEDFDATLTLAESSGFKLTEKPEIAKSLAALLEK